MQRNRAKRLLREAFRGVKDRLSGSFDLVLVARPEAAASSLAPVSDELEHLLRRARILAIGPRDAPEDGR